MNEYRVFHNVACFASAGWMTFRNLKERDCNGSGTLRVLPPLPSPRSGVRATGGRVATPRSQHGGCGSDITRRSSSDVLCAVSSN
jgi:hypothetical protein